MSYGLRSVSMDDISRKLGMSKKTIYQFVDNKDDLVKEVLSQFLIREHEVIQGISKESSDAIEEYINMARHFLETVKKMKPTITFDLQKYYQESWQLIEIGHFSFLRNIIEENIKTGVKQKLYRDNVDPIIISKLYVSNNHAIANEELFPSEQYPKHELLIQFVRYHLRGIASEKGLVRMKEILNSNL